MTTLSQIARETAAEKCGTVCGHTRFVCDREKGHDGAHRAYIDTVDENVFWHGQPKSLLKEPSLDKS